MMLRLPLLVQRLLSLILFFAVLAGIYALTVAPVLEIYRSGLTEIADARNRLGRFQSAFARDTKAIPGVADRIKNGAKSELFLNDETEALLLANLQSSLKVIASASGARFQGARSLPIRTDGDLRYVGVRLNVTGSVQSLQNMLHAIESAQPYLFVENAHLRNQQPHPNAVRTAPVTIVAELDVFGASKK